MSKLILGTAQLGLKYGINNQLGQPNISDAFSILKEAYDSGIRILDTAEVYGSAHEIISEFHSKNKQRFKIITKYSLQNDNYPKNLIERVNYHCSHLKVDSLECYMFHKFEDFLYYVKEEKSTLTKLKGLGIKEFN